MSKSESENFTGLFISKERDLKELNRSIDAKNSKLFEETQNALDKRVLADSAILDKYRNFYEKNKTKIKPADDNILNLIGYNEECDDDDGDDDAFKTLLKSTSYMTPDSQTQFLKNQVLLLQNELKKKSLECTSKGKRAKNLENRIKELKTENGSLLKSKLFMEHQTELFKKSYKELTSKNHELERELSTLKKEHKELQEKMKKGPKENALMRRVSEIDKLRTSITSFKQQLKEAQISKAQQLETSQSKNKNLQKHLSLLSKNSQTQGKLIDVYKKQLANIKMLTKLSFVEQEFRELVEGNGG